MRALLEDCKNKKTTTTKHQSKIKQFKRRRQSNTFSRIFFFFLISLAHSFPAHPLLSLKPKGGEDAFGATTARGDKREPPPPLLTFLPFFLRWAAFPAPAFSLASSLMFGGELLLFHSSLFLLLLLFLLPLSRSPSL